MKSRVADSDVGKQIAKVVMDSSGNNINSNNSATTSSSLDLSASAKTDQSKILSSPQIYGNIHVTILSVRALPLKETSINFKVGPIVSVLPKLFVHMSLKPFMSQCPQLFKTGGQPKKESGIFRDDFTFENVNISLLLAELAQLHFTVILKTPLSLISEDEVIGSTAISLMSLLPLLGKDAAAKGNLKGTGTGAGAGATMTTNTVSVKWPSPVLEWYTLHDSVGVALPNHAALQLKISFSS
jgi:hypothetical protein